MRTLLTKNWKIALTMCGVVILACAGFIANNITGGARPQLEPVFFFDLNTGELFVQPFGTEPPVAAPSGPMPSGHPAGVRAYVFSCDGHTATSNRFGYLESKAIMPESQGGKTEMIVRAAFVEGNRTPPTWFDAGSTQGKLLAEDYTLRGKCGQNADLFDQVLPK